MFNLEKLSFYGMLAKTWITARLEERTTYDGVVIIAICGSYIIFDGLIIIGAYAGILYGLWTMWHQQK
tara:strand:- start:589 stop:792 length:204 start_codon:yes stop_codon:yes gene_type:complete